MASFLWCSDELWGGIELLLPQFTRGMLKVDDRRVLSRIVHALKTGARWSDCPKYIYGPIRRSKIVPTLGRARLVGTHLPARRGGRACRSGCSSASPASMSNQTPRNLR